LADIKKKGLIEYDDISLESWPGTTNPPQIV
jgi:hypothetical protein